MTEFTNELLYRLTAAQIRHTINTLTAEGPEPADDGADDVMGACDLTSKLVFMTTGYPNMLDDFAKMFDPASGYDSYIGYTCASDGVCPEISALLPDDDDPDKFGVIDHAAIARKNNARTEHVKTEFTKHFPPNTNIHVVGDFDNVYVIVKDPREDACLYSLHDGMRDDDEYRFLKHDPVANLPDNIVFDVNPEETEED